MKKLTCMISIAAMILVNGCNHKDNLYRTGVSVHSSSMTELGSALKYEPLRYLDTNGSAASLRLLQKGLLDFAVVRNDILNKANEDREKSGENILYAAVAKVADETCYLVTRKDSNINSIFDLRGKKVAVGRQAHGTIHVAGNIFDAHGFRKSLVTPVYIPFRESAEKLISGEIDALFGVDVYPSQRLKDLAEKIPIKLLSLDEDAIKPLLGYNRGYAIRNIPAGTYEWQDTDVTAVKVNTVIMANQNVPDDVIENIILKLAQHNASKIDTPDDGKRLDQHLKEQLALLCKKEFGLSFHPAAAKLYKEYGIEVEMFEKNVGLNTVLVGQD